MEVDRERAGASGVTAQDVAHSLVAATSSSRFVVPNFWADPNTGIGYQVQVEIPTDADGLGQGGGAGAGQAAESDAGQLFLRDVARRRARARCPASTTATTCSAW